MQARHRHERDRAQCIRNNVSFYSCQSGAHFLKNGKEYTIPARQLMSQAHRAGIDFERSI